ncbi:hypothetical protein J6590_089204 [Homalodisca vitripennis]|nr:hypothetical protein J6590_089204 [Homalodisca vitripennis]
MSEFYLSQNHSYPRIRLTPKSGPGGVAPSEPKASPHEYLNRQSESRSSPHLSYIIRHRNDVCWCHWRFGDQARKCTIPCHDAARPQEMN